MNFLRQYHRKQFAMQAFHCNDNSFADRVLRMWEEKNGREGWDGRGGEDSDTIDYCYSESNSFVAKYRRNTCLYDLRLTRFEFEINRLCVSEIDFRVFR